MTPMADLRLEDGALRAEIEAGFREVLASGRFVLGPNVRAFEAEVAAHLGVGHAVGCGSGTDALHLALRSLGVGAGDEVITTPFTFFATAEAIVLAGAKPVFVDIDPATFNIDPEQLESAISNATRAVLPVHLFGQPAAMEEIMASARHHDLHVVEDCCQAFDATRGGRVTGTFGAAGCFSFFPSKNLGACGDGGLVTCEAPPLAERLRSLRNHGSSDGGPHDEIGLNSRLDELQAVVLRARLKRIEHGNAQRRRLARRYDESLGPLPGVVLPEEDSAGEHVYHQYTIRVENRDRVRQALAEQGIATAVHYPLPLHRQPALADHCEGQRFPVAEAVAESCLSLPIYPEMPDATIERVARALENALDALA